MDTEKGQNGYQNYIVDLDYQLTTIVDYQDIDEIKKLSEEGFSFSKRPEDLLMSKGSLRFNRVIRPIFYYGPIIVLGAIMAWSSLSLASSLDQHQVKYTPTPSLTQVMKNLDDLNSNSSYNLMVDLSLYNRPLES